MIGDASPNPWELSRGRYVSAGDTRLFVLELGEGYPVIALHGGPGLDHTVFRPWLDPLADRFRLIYVDQRGHGRSDLAPDHTLTLGQLVRDVDALVAGLGLVEFALLGHAFGSFVALEHAVRRGTAGRYVVAGCVPSFRWLERIDDALTRFEPEEIRQSVEAAWRREHRVQTVQELRSVLRAQLPFHLKEPNGDAYAAFLPVIDRMRASPGVVRAFARRNYDPIDVEDRLGGIGRPLLVLAGRYDRVCVPEAGRWIAEHAPGAEFVLLEEAGHLMYVEQPEAFRTSILEFFKARKGGDQ